MDLGEREPNARGTEEIPVDGSRGGRRGIREGSAEEIRQISGVAARASAPGAGGGGCRGKRGRVRARAKPSPAPSYL